MPKSRKWNPFKKSSWSSLYPLHEIELDRFYFSLIFFSFQRHKGHHLFEFAEPDKSSRADEYRGAYLLPFQRIKSLPKALRKRGDKSASDKKTEKKMFVITNRPLSIDVYENMLCHWHFSSFFCPFLTRM